MTQHILFIGDPHIKPDNGDEIDILLNEIERVFHLKKYDAIVIGGDVMHYHERLFTQALNKALEFIRRLSTLAFTYILVGNHDAVNNSIFLTDQHWMNALKTWDRVKIVDTVIKVDDMILCPYVPPGRFIEALTTLSSKESKESKESEWQNASIIFAHQEFKGCKMGAILSEDGDEWKYDYPTVVSGHIHDFQKVGENIYYPGSPLQHSFGDSDQRFLCDIFLNNDVKIEFISINVPVRKIVKASSKTLNEVVNKVKKSLSSEGNNKIKIKLETTTEEFNIFKSTKEYKELVNSGVKIQLIKNLQKTNVDINTIKNEYDFQHILEELIKTDEVKIQRIYNELFLEKLVIEL